MGDIAAFTALFLSAFTSATLLPGSSEAVLLGMLAGGIASPVALVVVAATGNVLGSVVNWVLGRYVTMFRDRRWFPVGPAGLARAEGWYRRWGVWSLLLAWVPVIGDPLTVVAGVLRVGFWQFLILVGIGKTGRYAFIAAAFAMLAPG